uniref:Uncharacterized protein n=1 Tax=Siphoviridae sp. ctP0x5 TaxID=2827863 RepID=A0A8S5TGK8_9CAUD|nr:MAG TPA: hypothetical protein [Siphoviridae sp. ctP0x5]DAM50414.1 MAG TPA: hypothetical protein [Caudoviricetes sp.]
MGFASTHNCIYNIYFTIKFQYIISFLNVCYILIFSA